MAEADDRPGVSHKLVVLLVATADREALRTIRLYREAA